MSGGGGVVAAAPPPPLLCALFSSLPEAVLHSQDGKKKERGFPCYTITSGPFAATTETEVPPLPLFDRRALLYFFPRGEEKYSKPSALCKKVLLFIPIYGSFVIFGARENRPHLGFMSVEGGHVDGTVGGD